MEAYHSPASDEKAWLVYGQIKLTPLPPPRKKIDAPPINLASGPHHKFFSEFQDIIS